MNTDSARRVRHRDRARPARRRGFTLGFVVVIALLAILAAAGAVASLTLGPRVTSVQVDPSAAVQYSGARLIVTTSVPLQDVDVSQITVTPESPFAVDTSGRSVGVRFTRPLHDDTDYVVVIDEVRGVGGGAASTITERFRTPAASVYLLQRHTDSGDVISRSGLDGQDAVQIFTHPHIEDFRATSEYLVVSVENDSGQSELIVTDADGANAQQVTLPGDGTITHLQSADRGDRIGYTYTDRAVSENTGREALLFTSTLDDPGADPVPIAVTGSDPRVAEWRFVPATDSILSLSFDGTLLLTDGTGGGATALGSAVTIEGIARGSTRAIIERVEGRVVLDLSDASEAPLVAPNEDLGAVGFVTPLPDNRTIRVAALLDETGLPTGGARVGLVDAVGQVSPLLEIASTDALLHTCVSPSARYAAFMVATDAVNNGYDTYQLPLPERIETRIVEIDGSTQYTVPGFDISWCQVPPL